MTDTVIWREGAWSEQGERLDVRRYGAVGDGVADDTAAVQAALDAVKVDGGTVTFEQGTYRITSTLDLTEALKDVVLVGLGTESGQGSTPPSVLLFTGGSGAGPLLDVASKHGLTCQGMAFRYNDPVYDGDLVKAGHSVFQDPHYLAFVDCTFGGDMPSGAQGARSLLNLDRAIFVTAERCSFSRADRGIWGRDGNYSNVIKIDRCDFYRIVQDPIYNPGQSWTVINSSFEPRMDGSAGGVKSGADFCRGLVYVGNWHGDISVDGGSWVDILALGASITGNYFGDPGPEGVGSSVVLRTNSLGIAISGNRFDGPTGIEIGTAPVRGVSVTGNDFGATVANIANRANASNIVCVGNNDASALGAVNDFTVAGTTFQVPGSFQMTGANTTWLHRANTAAQSIFLTRASGSTVDQFSLTPIGRMEWGDGTASRDVQVERGGANLLRLATDDAFSLGSAAGSGGSFLQGFEQSADPAAPAADGGRMFFKDDGAGKTQLCVRFNTGATQVIATEP